MPIIVKTNNVSLFKRKVNLKSSSRAMDGSTNLNSNGKRLLILKPMKSDTLSGDSSLNSVTPIPSTSFADDDSGFLQPTKRKMASSKVIQPRRYVLDSTQLCKQNQYQSLSDHSYAGSTPKMSDYDMDNEDIVEETRTKKTEKISPIFIHDANNHQEIIKDIKSVVTDDFSTQLSGQCFKVNLTSIDDFRKLTKFYDDSNIKYHTFRNLQDKKLEVVIRNVPTSLSENELKTELLDLSYPVIKVVRLLKKDKTGHKPYPLCAVELENNEDGKEIFNLDKLCHALVRVEPKRKSNNIPQCTRCQRYNHTKNFCKLDPRCVRCLGQHHYSECPNSKSEVPQCVNCGESHTANFRGCKLYQDLKLKSMNKSTTGRLNNKSKPTNQDTTNNHENPPNLLSETDFPQTLKSMATSFSNAVRGSSSNQPDSGTSSSNEPSENPSMSNLEKVIMDLVKSFMPLIKKIVSNVISSYLNDLNGSV